MTGTNLHWWKWMVIYWKHFFWNAWRTEHGHGELQIQLLVILLLRPKWNDPWTSTQALSAIVRGPIASYAYSTLAHGPSTCKSRCDGQRPIAGPIPLLFVGLPLECLQFKMWCLHFERHFAYYSFAYGPFTRGLASQDVLLVLITWRSRILRCID